MVFEDSEFLKQMQLLEVATVFVEEVAAVVTGDGNEPRVRSLGASRPGTPGIFTGGGARLSAGCTGAEVVIGATAALVEA